MPIYNYRCDKCEEEFRVSHSMTENQEVCNICGSIGTLTRVPSFFSKKPINKKDKVGTYVKDFIKDAKTDLEQQKEKLRERNG
tara:strand:+ start:2589 stop:2837 length:249 start_codon:yes stop_codon:yes gene_type:complete